MCETLATAPNPDVTASHVTVPPETDATPFPNWTLMTPCVVPLESKIVASSPPGPLQRTELAIQVWVIDFPRHALVAAYLGSVLRVDSKRTKPPNYLFLPFEELTLWIRSVMVNVPK